MHFWPRKVSRRTDDKNTWCALLDIAKTSRCSWMIPQLFLSKPMPLNVYFRLVCFEHQRWLSSLWKYQHKMFLAFLYDFLAFFRVSCPQSERYAHETAWDNQQGRCGDVLMSGNGAGSCSLEQSLQEGAYLGQTKKCIRFASGCMSGRFPSEREKMHFFGLWVSFDLSTAGEKNASSAILVYESWWILLDCRWSKKSNFDIHAS